MMDLRDFAERLDRHGPDLGRWPGDAATAAAALLAASPRAEAMRRDAAIVEACLRAGTPAVAPEAAGRVAARAARHRQERPARRGMRPVRWAAAAAAALALGVLVGGTTVGSRADDNPDQMLASALDGGGGTVDVD